MLTVSDVALSFGERVLFKDVNLKFTPGNCYGLIGANGSGKSTFLKLLSGELEVDTGIISFPPSQRMATLVQDRSAFDSYSVIYAIIKGHARLYDLMLERDELYAKTEMTDEEGMRVAALENEFAEMGGYEAESEAAILLSGLGVEEDLHTRKMSEIDEDIKVRVLVAQALFGNPDILLLDEPTNHLDIESINWLEDFLRKFDNTVIVVSHDRHFLNNICNHIADIDYNAIKIFYGNYSFWQQASQLIQRQKKDQKKKAEVRAAELREFISRFAANAAKSKQATSRVRELEKLDLDSLPQSSRRFPYCQFKPKRPLGKIVLEVKGLSKKIESEQLFTNWDMNMQAGEKIGFVGPNNLAKSAFMDVIAGKDLEYTGEFRWGSTVNLDYLSKDRSIFNNNTSITDWLREYSDEKDEACIRSFLGRMLFTREESLKKLSVLSGGEKVRCLLSRMMLYGPNILILDDPTGHLDLESITSLNNGLIDFQGSIIFASHDHQFINTIANRIIEFTPAGVIDKSMNFEEYLENREVAALRDKMYGGKHQRMRI